jgi:hypothetical protein
MIGAAIGVKGSLAWPCIYGRFLLYAKGHYLSELLPLGRIFGPFDGRMR